MDQSYLNRSTHTRTQLPWAQTRKCKNDKRIHNTEILKTNRLKTHTHTHTRRYHSDSFSCTQSAQTQICNLSLSLQQPLQTFRPRQISSWLHYLTQLSLHLLPVNLADTDSPPEQTLMTSHSLYHSEEAASERRMWTVDSWHVSEGYLGWNPRKSTGREGKIVEQRAFSLRRGLNYGFINKGVGQRKFHTCSFACCETFFFGEEITLLRVKVPVG